MVMFRGLSIKRENSFFSTQSCLFFSIKMEFFIRMAGTLFKETEQHSRTKKSNADVRSLDTGFEYPGSTTAELCDLEQTHLTALCLSFLI